MLWRNLRHRSRVEKDLDDELRASFDLLVDEMVAEGVSPTDARRAARLELGSAESLKEEVRDVRQGAALDVLLRDSRYALRRLRRSPGFALVATLTLALGIGANTAVFSVVHAVLLSPLPYPEADRLIIVHSRNLQLDLTEQGHTPAVYREFEKRVTSFENIAAFRYNYANLTRVEQPTQLTDSLVTWQFFDLFGVKPMLGRTFLPEDAAAGAPAVVVLSHSVWQTHFGGRATLVGETITLDDQPVTVIGIMPKAFKEPANIAAAWRVFPNDGGENLTSSGRFLSVFARLKPGQTPLSVQPELATIAARFAQMDSAFYGGWDFTTTPLRDALVGNFRDGLLLVDGAALLVLLITCANLAGLQLARASTRQQEIAVRRAIGASRWAIARQQLTESLVLVVFGGAGGALLGKWGLDLLLASWTGWFPRLDEIAVNTTVLAITGGVALLTVLAFGLLPALRATNIDAVDALRDGAKGSSGPQPGRVRSVLVAGQIAITLVLLVCAGLVVRSFAAILRVDPGMQIDNTLSLGICPSTVRYDTPEKRAAYYRRIIERVNATPGVEASALTQTLPFTRRGFQVAFTVDGRGDDAGKLPSPFYDSVSEGFFSTMRIPLIAGRAFTEADTLQTPRVMIISQSTAKQFFPNEDPIGRRLIPPRDAPPAPAPSPLKIVGIVGDVPRNGLNASTPYQVYTPIEQRPFDFATLLVRSSLPVDTLTNPVQKQIWSLDPDQPISNIAPVRSLVRADLSQPQLYLTLFSLFAVLALLLAALGLYGLIAYSVAQRTREFGIRVALGAQNADVLRLVLGQGARLTAIGLIVGLLAAAAAARLMQALLFRTTTHDPLVFGVVVLVLAAVALVAALLAAHRATKVDPMIALRAE